MVEEKTDALEAYPDYGVLSTKSQYGDLIINLQIYITKFPSYN